MPEYLECVADGGATFADSCIVEPPTAGSDGGLEACSSEYVYRCFALPRFFPSRAPPVLSSSASPSCSVSVSVSLSSSSLSPPLQ